MLKTILLLSCTLLLLNGCAMSPQQVYQGENLILPKVKELQQWQQFEQQDPTSRATMWQRPGDMWADTFAVTIAQLDEQNLTVKRAHIDQPGIEHCQVFVSEILEHPRSDEYVSLYWQSKCLQKGRVSTRMLHLMIKGQERFYHIQKAWGRHTTAEDVSLWKSRFLATYLCNTADQPNSCP